MAQSMTARASRGLRECLGGARLPASAQVPGTMDAVRGRGQLVCSVSTGVAGFSLPDSQGVTRGLDADS